MNPSDAKKASIPVMDFLFGRAIELEVQPGPGKPGDERYTRETKYVGEFSDEVVSCVNPDGSAMLNDDEMEVLDTYVTKMNKVWKSKDAETRTALLEEVNADPNTAALKKIYKRVLDNIKTVCPNLTEHLGYKEWNDELKERVNHWIEVVLTGNNPATVNSAPAALTEQTTAPEPTQTHGGSTAIFDGGSDDDDTDLPF